MKGRAELMALLESLGIATETLDHPAVFRVGEGEEIKAGLRGAHTKNLFLKDAKDILWLVSAADRAVIDLKRLAGAIGAARFSFGSEARLMAALGVSPGSVTAFALINDEDHQVRFVLDRALAEADFVNFHPMTNTATTTISGPAFARFLAALGVQPIIVDLESGEPAKGSPA